MAEEKTSGEVEFVERKRWLFFGLPFTFTVYTVKSDMLNIREGFFKTIENDCYMYKVQDVELERSLLEKMCGLGTVVCYTGDTTHPKLFLSHIKNSHAVKDYILKESEEARLRRRTVNMLDIGTGDLQDIHNVQDMVDAGDL